MKTIRVTIDGKLLLMRQCDDTVTVGDILQRTTRALDKLKLVKESKDIEPPSDYFGMFIDALAREHSTTKDQVLSKRRDGMLPTLRALAASAWMQVTNEQLQYTAARIGFDHSSCSTALSKLAERERKKKDLRRMHQDAITLCRFVCMKGVSE